MYTLHIFEDDNPNYVASCVLMKYGDRAFTQAITGSHFYSYLRQPNKLLTICDELGVKSFEGYVTPKHARACQIFFRDVAKVECQSVGTMNNTKMVWVVTTPYRDVESG